MLTFDGENCILGRLASEVAKKALTGEDVRVFNAEKIVITGSPTQIVERWKQKSQFKDVADPENASPRFTRRPDLFVKRVIRGMLPRRSIHGRDALARIKIFMGKTDSTPAKKIAEARNLGRTISVGELCEQLGWKK